VEDDVLDKALDLHAMAMPNAGAKA
jgi:hypothetical protein